MTTRARWIDPTPVDVSDDLREAVGGHPLVAQTLVRRGFDTPSAARRFLDYRAYRPAEPDTLPDLEKAAERVRRAIDAGEMILVWGDFDVDGQTSTALLVSALRDLGGRVVYHIPNRFTEGHGIGWPVLGRLLKQQGVGLLLTCDTGITAFEAIEQATASGVEVIVTDHHALAADGRLPHSFANVNPIRAAPDHPMRELPGVGVAYQLVRSLYGTTSSEHLLDLVALGIVADVMVQTDDTRYWLQRGLDVLRANQRPSLRELLRRADIDPASLTETNIGFGIAPRLNALGRLADANPAVELLTTDDPTKIVERVNELEGLNAERKFKTRQVYEAAQEMIEREPALLRYAALVLSAPEWHTGVVGIVASRLADDYGCPVILLSEHDGVAAGSARSVAGCDIVRAIGSQSELLLSYGGHNMAAGCRLLAEHIPAFRRGLSYAVRQMIGKDRVDPQIDLDGVLSLAELDLALAQDLTRLAPFGNGNPALTLMTPDLALASTRSMGRKDDHLELRVEDTEGATAKVKWWFADRDALPPGRFDLAYTLRVNVFRGEREALIEWRDARPAAGAGAYAVVDTRPTYAITDWRDLLPAERAQALQHLLREYPDALVWWEHPLAGDDTPPGSQRATRLGLRSAEVLVVGTPPASPDAWRAGLDVVDPARLVLGWHEMPDLPTVLRFVLQMAFYAENQREGLFGIERAAAALGTRPQLVRATLRLWVEAGALAVDDLTEDQVRVTVLQRKPTLRGDLLSGRSSRRVQAIYDEIRAWQQYWRAADWSRGARTL